MAICTGINKKNNGHIFHWESYCINWTYIAITSDQANKDVITNVYIFSFQTFINNKPIKKLTGKAHTYIK